MRALLRRSLVVVVLVGLYLGTGCSNNGPTAPTAVEPTPLPPPTGMSYVTVPSDFIRAKKLDGADSPFSFKLLEILPRVGIEIFGSRPGSPPFGCGAYSEMCFQFKVEACSERDTSLDIRVYLSPNPGEAKNARGGARVNPGCGNIMDYIAKVLYDQAGKPSGLEGFSGFPVGEDCCRYMDIDFVELPMIPGQRGNVAATASVFLGYKNRIP
jgi:hypothetical protein